MLPNNPAQINPLHWNTAIARLKGAHVLQTWEWSKVKSQFGWQPNYLLWFKVGDQVMFSKNDIPSQLIHQDLAAAALTLQRNIKIGGFARHMGVMYSPKGPVLDWEDQPLRLRVMSDLQVFAQKQRAIFIKVDPDVEVGRGVPGRPGSSENPLGERVIHELKSSSWQFSDEQVQFRNTVFISLAPSEKELLANMKQKTRYNVNLAIRKGVSVRVGALADVDMLLRMYAETSVRDGFVIRNDSYYRQVWNTFMFSQEPKRLDQPVAEALIAEVDGEPVAGAIIFRFAGKAWYLYGMSRLAHRDKMPNYLLQWEAIKRTKAAGCSVYDLWGAPDEFVESDPLWGVYRFKEGLGGTVHRHIGAWDLPINGMFYTLYSKTLPGLMDIMRKHGRARTKQSLG
jgi:peptidoglycan pentaglycine glycine transferase (the first glycine)